MYIDLLIKIKNAEAAGKRGIKSRYTKMDYAIATILQKAGFLKKVEIKGKTVKKIMEIHFNGERLVEGMRFLSKPSLRRYGGFQDFRKIKGGHGILVVSTPKGILTGGEARRAKVGGQLLLPFL